MAVVRLSGAGAPGALEALGAGGLEPRQATVRWLREPEGRSVLDQALVIRFEAGGSFTGEAAGEIQCHGGPAVLSALLDALARLPGLRLAEPGEFARRALENGRLSLLEAEALADLIEAETEAQRRLALRAKRGALGGVAEGWRQALVRARALCEAVIDFADEEVPEDVGPEVRALVAEVRAGLARELAGAAAAERLREGFEVVLLGPPNSGKSSLLNALVRRDAAIVSAVAGTTRDVIEVRMDLRGLPVTVLDTAGLREVGDEIEAEGVRRARARADAADLRVWLQAPGGEPASEGVLRAGDLVVASKADLGVSGEGLRVSAVTGEGVDGLAEAIAGRLEGRAAGASAVMRVRHRVALEAAAGRLAAAEGWLGGGDGALDLAAEELRGATGALEALLGRVDAEDVLDDIFASFCLGK